MQLKEFFKAVSKDKGKITWYFLVIFFYSILNIYVLNHIEESNWIIFVILGFFDLIALPMALYQPYKEWKDGNN